MKWKEIKGNREEVERYISTALKPKHKQTKLNFGAFSSYLKANSLTMDNDDNTVPCVIIPPTSPSTVKLPSLSDFSAETPAIIKTAIDFERHKIKYFLENFSSLITDDVMRNDSFISGFSKFVEILLQFKSLESSYLDDVQRSKKSKFQLLDISKRVTFLFDNAHGTAQLSVFTTKKNIFQRMPLPTLQKRSRNRK